MWVDAPRSRLLIVALALSTTSTALATRPDPADSPTERFLSKVDRQPSYRATRRLEAVNGNRTGWLEATTSYSADAGFRYQILRGGGSDYIQGKVLKAVLEGEADAFTRGEASRSRLARTNYTFQPNGIDADGLANVLLSPRRKERALLSGVMFIRPDGAELVRVQGRLAKNPSFWVKDVDIVRRYERINTAVVPVAVESTAKVRLLGAATFSMTYDYDEIDGHAVSQTPVTQNPH
jgi:hypothetical protein